MIWYPINNQDEEPEIDSDAFLSNRSQRTENQRPKLRNHRTNRVSIHRYSYHAQLRTAQRCLSPDDVEYILHHGRYYHADGAIFYLLVSKDIPEADRHEMSRLIGTAVIVNKDHSTIISSWRNRQSGTRNIRRALLAFQGAGSNSPDLAIKHQW
jgi:hypothetical protein